MEVLCSDIVCVLSCSDEKARNLQVYKSFINCSSRHCRWVVNKIGMYSCGYQLWSCCDLSGSKCSKTPPPLTFVTNFTLTWKTINKNTFSWHVQKLLFAKYIKVCPILSYQRFFFCWKGLLCYYILKEAIHKELLFIYAQPPLSPPWHLHSLFLVLSPFHFSEHPIVHKSLSFSIEFANVK